MKGGECQIDLSGGREERTQARAEVGEEERGSEEERVAEGRRRGRVLEGRWEREKGGEVAKEEGERGKRERRVKGRGREAPRGDPRRTGWEGGRRGGRGLACVQEASPQCPLPLGKSLKPPKTLPGCLPAWPSAVWLRHRRSHRAQRCASLLLARLHRTRGPTASAGTKWSPS